MSTFPELVRNGTRVDLFVGGEPRLLIAGEVRNSSASTLEFIDPLWSRLGALNLNALFLPISWRQFEPEEHHYDDRLLSGLIARARTEGLFLVLLWFGSWKNGLSGYAPTWVLSNPARFPRMSPRALSPFGEQTLEADRRAFVRFMETVRRCDPRGEVVVMVQVENEIGILGDSRDRTPLAQAALHCPVARDLTRSLERHEEALDSNLREAWASRGRRRDEPWAATFGEGSLSDEAFMAWHLARFVEQVAAAGKQVHPLPMFVNAWTVDPSDPRPGVHPSGGPVAGMLDVWMAAAPSIDLYAVDNYREDFRGECRAYTRRGNPLFIPEAAGWWGSDSPASSAAKAFFAFGSGALAYAPFGIDNQFYEQHRLRSAYQVLRQLEPLLLRVRGTDRLRGFYRVGEEASESFQLGGYKVTIRYALGADSNQMFETGLGSQEPFGSFGLILQEAENAFLVAGRGFQADFEVRQKDERLLVLNLGVEEGIFDNGVWRITRVLNGDEVPEQGTGGVKLPPGACPVPGEPEVAILRLRLGMLSA